MCLLQVDGLYLTGPWNSLASEGQHLGVHTFTWGGGGAPLPVGEWQEEIIAKLCNRLL